MSLAGERLVAKNHPLRRTAEAAHRIKLLTTGL